MLKESYFLVSEADWAVAVQGKGGQYISTEMEVASWYVVLIRILRPREDSVGKTAGSKQQWGKWQQVFQFVIFGLYYSVNLLYFNWLS